MLEAMLVQVFRADVGMVAVGRDVVYRNASFRHQLSNVKEAQSDVIRPGTEGAVSQRVQQSPCCRSTATLAQTPCRTLAWSACSNSFDLKLTGAFSSFIR